MLDKGILSVKFRWTVNVIRYLLSVNRGCGCALDLILKQLTPYIRPTLFLIPYSIFLIPLYPYTLYPYTYPYTPYLFVSKKQFFPQITLYPKFDSGKNLFEQSTVQERHHLTKTYYGKDTRSKKRSQETGCKIFKRKTR